MIQTHRIWWPKAQERRSIIALLTKLGKIAYAEYEQRKAKAKLGVIFGLGIAQITRTARAVPTVLQ